MTKMQLLIGTANRHKRDEIKNILDFPNVEVISLADISPLPAPEENGASFEENAFIKAQYYFEKTGIPCLADDSGLCVKILDNGPGIYSSRFASLDATDMDNNDKLLRLLDKEQDRSAFYTCALAFVDGETEYATEGNFSGWIGTEFRGKNGFGYDPIFYFEDKDGIKSVAELTADKKNNISHRANALRIFHPWFKRYLDQKQLDKT